MVDLSIIIPTLNEENYLAKTVEHLLRNARYPDRLEILVIDAGSMDGTVASVKELPVKLWVEPSFQLQKHRSLNEGIAKSNAELLLFLDADTLLPPFFDDLVRSEIRQENTVGGAFEMRFQRASVPLYLLSLLNALRYRVFRTFYGDQAVFCQKKMALKVGGFPDTLMEAAYFCRALKKQGRLGLISTPVRTSPRRFEEHGFWKVLGYDILMWIRFIFGKQMKRQATVYWNKNLENG